MVDIAVVDYGMGNLRSVHNALEAVAPGSSVVVTDDPGVVSRAGRVVFPGQGAMPDCMRELDGRNLRNAVLDAARNKPFLGICIGLQMLFEHSTEGDVPCLGILPGEVVRFPHELRDAQGTRLKVPHMGWNQVHHAEHAMWRNIAQDERFYFVHSYYVKPSDPSIVQAESNYPAPFVCAVSRENIFAVQFHPEKSHAPGLQLLENFVNWNPV
jgi:imidazole glycerol-phosphate synthase subunit HisH